MRSNSETDDDGRGVKAVIWNGTAAVLTEVAQIEASPASVRIEAAYVGLCGTDIHLIDGHHPRAHPGIVLGHEFSGRVHLDEPVADWRDGDPVFVNPWVTCGTCEMCTRDLENHCERFAVIGIDRAGSLTRFVDVPLINLVRIPDSMVLSSAALIEPVATAARAMKRAHIRGGEHVHVVGFGPIGFFVAVLARRLGAAHITVSEESPGRAAFAEEMGFEIASSPSMAADVVFECVGAGLIPATLTSWVKPYGTVVVVGLYPAGLQEFNLHDVMIRELTVVGTKAYTRSDIDDAVKFLDDGPAELRSVISAVVGLDAVGEAIEGLRGGRGMKVLVNVTGRT